jgi:hypothetical protein
MFDTIVNRGFVFFLGNSFCHYLSGRLSYTQGVFNTWPAGHMWPAEPFAVARRPFGKNNYKHWPRSLIT